MTAIASGSNAVVTVTSNQQIAINTAPGVQCVIEATSGVQGSTSKMRLANHKGGFGIYGPFGAGTVTLYAIGGQVDYDATDPLESVDGTQAMRFNPTTGVKSAAGVTLPSSRLAASAVASGITDSPAQSTTESTLATLVIPALTLGVDDGLEIETIWSCTNTAATKRIRGRFGGTVLWNLDLTTHLVYRMTFKLRNRNSRASQVSQANSTTIFGPIGSVAAQTFTVDFSAEQTLTITGQFPVAGSSANTLTLEEYTVRVV